MTQPDWGPEIDAWYAHIDTGTIDKIRARQPIEGHLWVAGEWRDRPGFGNPRATHRTYDEARDWLVHQLEGRQEDARLVIERAQKEIAEVDALLAKLQGDAPSLGGDRAGS